MSANWFRYCLCVSSNDSERIRQTMATLPPEQALESLGLSGCLTPGEHISSLKLFSNHLRLDIHSDSGINYRLMRASKALGVEFIKVHARCGALDASFDSCFYRGVRPTPGELDSLLARFLPEDTLDTLVRNQDVAELTRLLSTGLDPNAPLGDEPLIYASVHYRSLSMFTLLLEQGANPEEIDSNGQDLMTRLFAENDKRLAPFIEVLLQQGWPSHHRLPDGGSILWHAFALDYELAARLHRQGFPFLRPHGIYNSGSTEQHIKVAIRHQDQPVLQRLLSGLNLNYDQLMVLAGLCTQVDNLLGFKLLESRGLKLEDNSDDMVELLQGAASSGAFRLVAYLLLKAEALMLDIDDCVADLVEYLVADDRAQRLIAILANRIRLFDHNRAIGTAIHHKALKNLEILLKANKPTRYRSPLLHDYLEDLSPESARMLLDAGENPAETNVDGETVFEALLHQRPNEVALHQVFHRALFDLPVNEYIWLLIAYRDTQGFEQAWLRLRNKQPENHQGDTLLLHACRHGARDIVAFLLDREQPLDHKDHDGNTALAIAVSRGHLDIARRLLDAGAKANDTLKIPSRSARASHRSLEVLLGTLSRLRQEAEALREPLLPHGRAPLLCYAAYLGDLAMAQLLLERGATLPASDREGCSALYFAVANGHRQLTEYLLAQGADAQEWFKGESLLHIACYRGHGRLIPSLLQAGLSLEDGNDADGDTPLHLAARMGAMHDEDLCSQLIAAGSVLDSQNLHGQTPLMGAILMLSHKSAAILLKAGASAEVLNKKGKSAFDYFHALGIPAPGLDLTALKPGGFWYRLHKLTLGLGRVTMWYLLPSALALGLVWSFARDWLPALGIGIAAWWALALVISVKQRRDSLESLPQLLTPQGNVSRAEDEMRFMASWDDEAMDIPLAPPRLRA
ncbi:ankyrin repeat domain-containing protein [Shewanella litorisediminis]|uniref:Ankyrin repeat domain-containing protein n=1 Tax=Shewanella litorisediminis TaxID=1173586 RepID=A0ABX7G530_9GAMM|nr:ankyrin repeat domain-containing protein [Shewanella litorisediminis]MCL2918017.1 ankyrin repeat domain-containing protein [Shewanella litorisediminis]QRH02447.1 ankyrin repeat domain-containing protein [Shewanella litorisediminis]